MNPLLVAGLLLLAGTALLALYGWGRAQDFTDYLATRLDLEPSEEGPQ